MKRVIKFINIFIILLSLIFINTSLLHAQKRKISLQAERISQNFIELKEDLNNNKLWANYLVVFPNNKKDFKSIFDPDDFSELYNGSVQYIFILNQAPANLKQAIVKLLLNITKTGAPGCCDAWSALYMVIENYVLNDTNDFIALLKPLKQKEKQNVIKFIADKEAIEFSKEYQTIIDILKSKNENELAAGFETARRQRISEPH
jgi:hypothetical protein